MFKYLFLISTLILASCGQTPTVNTPTDTPASEKVILALGDSLTAGYGLPVADSYPSQLETLLASK